MQQSGGLLLTPVRKLVATLICEAPRVHTNVSLHSILIFVILFSVILMTVITKENFEFSIDVEKTQKYYSANTVCNCSCCRNLCAQIETLSPKLTSFLSEFGVDICRPDEAASAESNEYIDYLFVGYTVVGSLRSDGQYETDIENYHITISTGETPYDWFPNEQKEPHFYITITGISLPWVLDEPFPKPERIADKFKRLFKKNTSAL